MKPLALIPQYFGSLVYDRRTHRYHPFDRSATRLLQRARLRPPTSRSASGFVRHFHQHGYWDLNGRFDGEVINVQPPPGASVRALNRASGGSRPL